MHAAASGTTEGEAMVTSPGMRHSDGPFASSILQKIRILNTSILNSGGFPRSSPRPVYVTARDRGSSEPPSRSSCPHRLPGAPRSPSLTDRESELRVALLPHQHR